MQPERNSNAAKERKRAVALVIYDQARYDQARYDKDRYDKARRHLLVVKRPPEDGRLANVWGLPAATLRVGESYEAGAVRTGQEKLGVKIKILGGIGEATMNRGDHILHMKEFEVEVREGTPRVPQPVAQLTAQPTGGVTQYVACKWGGPDDLVEAMRKGSLCCRLYLSSIGRLQGDQSEADSSLGSE